ncbi:MAG: GvpL/GvpF family gas vesicle protein [Planctomycetota bacterium]
MSDELHGLYFYGIARGATVAEQLAGAPSGLDGRPVFAVVAGALAAIVSLAPDGRLRPQRRALGAHQSVLKHIGARGPALPASFGVIAPSSGGLAAVLRANADTLDEQLTETAGCVEMGVKLRWDVDNVFADFVDRYEVLREARVGIAEGAASRDELIEIGQLFERLQGTERDEALAAVRGTIDTAARRVVANPPRSENEVLNIACLVERDREDGFDAAVQRAAESFDERFAFEISGPWPPFNFVSLRLEFDHDASGDEAAFEVIGEPHVEVSEAA